MTDLALEKRLAELNNTPYVSRSFFLAKLKSRKYAREASQKLGEPVVLEFQARSIAFLLGYGELSAYKCQLEGGSLLESLGVSLAEFKSEITPLIPEDARVSLPDIGIKAHATFCQAYKVNGLRKAFKKLAEAGKIEYEDERFDVALERL